MTELTIREMQPGDVWAMRKLARRSFGWIEGLFMLLTRPKTALVAVVDEKIVGGFVYKISQNGGKKIGLASLFFADPDLKGQGIGAQLSEAGIRHLWEVERCDALVTYVRDDNVASWGAFERQGFVQTSLPQLTKLIGPFGMAKLYLETGYGFSIGHDFYIAMPDGEATQGYRKKRGMARQFSTYLLIQFLLLVPFYFSHTKWLAFTAALAFLFLGNTLASYVGTLFSKRRWHFRLTTGGFLLCLIFSVANRIFIPVIASWYPDHYENTPRFRRDLAVTSMAGWLFLLPFAAITLFVSAPDPFLAYASAFATILLMIRCLPFSIGALGGERVFHWNKVVWGLQVVVTGLAAFVL